MRRANPAVVVMVNRPVTIPPGVVVRSKLRRVSWVSRSEFDSGRVGPVFPVVEDLAGVVGGFPADVNQHRFSSGVFVG